MDIRKILFSAVAAAASACTGLPALSTAALAADLPSRAPPPVYVPPVPVFSWTGVYVGGQVGYQWATSSASIYALGPVAIAAQPSYNQQGVIGGGHLGYNYQINQAVVGIEGDVEGTNYKGSGPYSSGLYTLNTSVDVQGSIRGRLGFAYDRALFYATGGVAFAKVESSYVNGGTGGADNYSSGRTGWTVGGGIQYAFTNNWSVRAEYRYTDLGTYNNVLANSSGSLLGARTHETDNSVRVGFSYAFNLAPPPAPVVAKY